MVGFGIAMVVSLLPFLIGIVTRSFVPASVEGDQIFSYITRELLSPALGGIIYTALLAALMTTGDSIILQGGACLTQDIYHRLLKPQASDKELMKASHWSVIIISLLSLIVALRLTNIIQIYQWALRLLGTTLLFPFLAAMFWRRTTSRAVAASMILTCLTTLTCPLLFPSINQTIAGFAVSALTLVVCSPLTKHSKSENVKVLYTEVL